MEENGTVITVDSIGVLTFFFSTTALVTNSFVAGVLIYQHRKLTTMLYFILNLLVLDGIFALIGVTFRAPGMLRSDYYTMNGVMVWLCPMVPLFIAWVPAQCSLAILLITFDRFLSIKYALRYSSLMTTTRAVLLIVGTWLLMFLKFLVELFLFLFTDKLDIKYDKTRLRCEFVSDLYVLAIQTFFYVVPFFIMVILYIVIIVEILRTFSSEPNRMKIKLLITTTLITTAFFVTWFPYYITCFQQVVLGVQSKAFNGTVVMFYANLLWDSVVYALRIPLVYKMVVNCCTKTNVQGCSQPNRGKHYNSCDVGSPTLTSQLDL